jgi:hypothetical protein
MLAWLFKICCEAGELLERGLQIDGDLLSDNFGIRQILGIFERVVLEPENVELRFVALDQFVVGEALEPLGLFLGDLRHSATKRADWIKMPLAAKAGPRMRDGTAISA